MSEDPSLEIRRSWQAVGEGHLCIAGFVDRLVSAPVRSWAGRAPRVLPGHGGPLRLFDTSSGSIRATTPGHTARMYVCGITPYDATHLGHAATYVAFDLVHRYWLDLGLLVEYAQNVTDVDDPLLERAAEDGQDWQELASAQVDLFAADMAALNVLPPTRLVGVVESLDALSDCAQTLMDHGLLYPVGQDLYFRVTEAPGFGGVCGLDPVTMRDLCAERGGDPDRQGKAHELDCLVWRGARVGEPAWDLPIGRGRPGWHIGCTAIALDDLGSGFDVLGGGSDLAFPHHEMCAAMGRAATGAETFAGHYVHAGMVGLDGEKMSKTLGNLVFVSGLRADGVDPAVIRVALLGHHYRSDWEWTAAELAAAERRIAAWQSALLGPGGPSGESLLALVRARLADDLDAPGALGQVDEWAARAAAGERPDPAAPGLTRHLLDTLLGVASPRLASPFAPEEISDDQHPAD